MTKYVALVLVLTSFGLTAQNPSAKEIVEAANDKMQGESSRGEMTMQIVRPKWTREIGIKSWTKGQDYSLMVITAPARDQGTGFLKREKELWNWQPTIDRIIKMPPSMMTQSWMGSDFTNDDLVKQSSVVDDYTHEIEKDTIIEGRDAWKIILTPREDAAVVWGKIEAYIAKENYYQLLFKYYDEDEFLVNTMIMSDIRKIGNRTIPTRMEMIPAEEPENRTVIIYKDFQFDLDIEESFFSQQNLKQLR